MDHTGGGAASAVPGAKRQNVYFKVALLIEQLKSEHEEERLSATKNVGHIAVTLGPDRTREELLPYLNEALGDDEDDVMKALAEQLGSFLPLVGGAHYCSHILVPLEALCTMEEVDVRKQAVKSIELIANSVPESQIALNFHPLLRRLARNEWFTSRVAACALIPVLYPRLSRQLQSECQVLLGELAKDPTPMVRRATMENLPAVIAAVDAKTLQQKIFPVFVELAADEQDSVRRLAINSCIALAETGADTHTEMIRCVQKLHADVSWRIRWSVANSFPKIAKSLGAEKLRAHLLSMYCSLLKDVEDEVRAAAALQVTKVSSLLSPAEIIEHLFMKIEVLADDENEHVRGALATVVMSVSPCIGKDLTVKHLLPIFLKMLKDVNPDVQLNIISSLEDVIKVVGVALLAQSLLPAIEELASDNKWRIRLAIIEQIPILGKQLGLKFFDHHMEKLFVSWLNDGFYQIREATAANLGILGGYFGTAWCRDYVLPMLSDLKNNPCYLQRMTCLSTLGLLCEKKVGVDPVASGILKDIVSMTKDVVPNVRFKAIKTLKAIAGLLPKNSRAELIAPVLRRLKTDGDEDVVYYANDALAACS